MVNFYTFWVTSKMPIIIKAVPLARCMYRRGRVSAIKDPKYTPRAEFAIRAKEAPKNTLR